MSAWKTVLEGQKYEEWNDNLLQRFKEDDRFLDSEDLPDEEESDDDLPAVGEREPKDFGRPLMPAPDVASRIEDLVTNNYMVERGEKRGMPPVVDALSKLDSTAATVHELEEIARLAEASIHNINDYADRAVYEPPEAGTVDAVYLFLTRGRNNQRFLERCADEFQREDLTVDTGKMVREIGQGPSEGNEEKVDKFWMREWTPDEGLPDIGDVAGSTLGRLPEKEGDGLDQSDGSESDSSLSSGSDHRLIQYRSSAQNGTSLGYLVIGPEELREAAFLIDGYCSTIYQSAREEGLLP